MNRESKTELIPKKRVDSPLANFVALLAGLVVAITLLLMVISRFTDTAVSRADAAKPVADVAVTNMNFGAKEFGKILETATTDELNELLIKANEWDRRNTSPTRIPSNWNRVKIADAMLTSELSPTQREFAVLSKIEALSAMYGMAFLERRDTGDIGPLLRATATKYREDDVPEIAKTARLAIVKIESFDFLQNSSERAIAPLIASIVDLMREYPDDEFVIASIKLIMISLVGLDRESSLDVMRGLANYQSEFRSVKTADLFEFLSDQVILARANVQTLFENRWVNGFAGQQELEKVTLALASDPSGGLDVLNSTEMIASWFEQNDQYSSAERIYQAMLDSADQRENIKASMAAKKYAKNGLSRCRLVGQKIKFEATPDSGEPLTDQDVRNRICVVIFWAADNPASLSAVLKFHNASRNLVSKQVSVFAYCIDETSRKSLSDVSSKIPNFQILVDLPNASGAATLLQQCPVSSLPTAMTINHRGTVIDVNVPMDELKTAIDYLIAERHNDR